jgi:hypothetical protein
VEGIVLSAIFRVFTIYNLWTGAYGRSVFLVRVMDFFQRGISAMMAFLGLGLGVSNRFRRAHLRVKHRSFFSELGGICSPTLRANQSLSEATVRNVFEASCPGLLAQKTVALFVTPSTHNRIFVLALLNQEVVPSWHSPTSMKSLPRTTDLNLWRIPIVLVYALVNATDRDASKWLPR